MSLRVANGVVDGATRYRAKLTGFIDDRPFPFAARVVGFVVVELHPHRPPGTSSAPRRFTEGISMLGKGHILGGVKQVAAGVAGTGEYLLASAGVLPAGQHALRVAFQLHIGSGQVEARREWQSYEDLRHLTDPVRFPATMRPGADDVVDVGFALPRADLRVLINIAVTSFRNPGPPDQGTSW